MPAASHPTESFVAPGPGSWTLDRSHYDAAITPLSDDLMSEATEAAYRDLFAELGVPAQGIEMRAVRGFVYTRIVPFLGGDSTSTRVPPEWIIKLVFKVHPELRRRERQATKSLEGEDFRRVLGAWRNEIRPRIVSQNKALQAVELQALSDGELAEHVHAAVDHVRATFQEHHRLHGYDLGPLALFVVSCSDWDIDTPTALGALAGASPSTNEPRRVLVQIRGEVDRAGIVPETLEDVRAVSARATELLDGYLEQHGAVVFSSYDVDGPTLSERPELVLATIMHAEARTSEADGTAAAVELRARVPEAERASFDQLLADAREAMDMRDDNGPITVEWPIGLLRMALLEAGSRLESSGKTEAVEHIFDVYRNELVPLIGSGIGPSAAVLADRHRARLAQRDLNPPELLGPPPAEPPLGALPPAMARTLAMTMAATTALGMTNKAEQASLTGTGIGERRFAGVARVAATAEDALAGLIPGEILVTRATSPAFNLVLGLAGGLVTVDGGPMSHAAVLSRELGLPAVIGVRDCLEHVSNGDRIELDPVAGTVRVLQ